MGIRVAVTRGVSSNIGECELTHLDREPIDVDLARTQHARYEQVLADLGCRIERLAEETDFPDSVFVEDIAVVLDEVAIITRPGALSRRGERSSIETTLQSHRPIQRIEPPGILDGGDVLVVGRDVYVGLSTRTNVDSVRQLREFVSGYGYRVTGVDFRDCLHLKSSATPISDDTLLVNPDWVDPSVFSGQVCVVVDPVEPRAANVVRVGDTVLFGSDFPRTGERLLAEGFDVQPVEATELAKAEGALTCCSLIFESLQV